MAVVVGESHGTGGREEKTKPAGALKHAQELTSLREWFQ